MARFIVLGLIIACFTLGSVCLGLETQVTPEQCLTNCAQCKQMFGVFFEGQRCAEYCLLSGQKLTLPDCQVAATLEKFIRSIYRMNNANQDLEKYDMYMKRLGKNNDKSKGRWFYFVSS